jgi:hypothetical protein
MEGSSYGAFPGFIMTFAWEAEEMDEKPQIDHF